MCCWLHTVARDVSYIGSSTPMTAVNTSLYVGYAWITGATLAYNRLPIWGQIAVTLSRENVRSTERPRWPTIQKTMRKMGKTSVCHKTWQMKYWFLTGFFQDLVPSDGLTEGGETVESKLIQDNVRSSEDTCYPWAKEYLSSYESVLSIIYLRAQSWWYVSRAVFFCFFVHQT